MDGINLPLLDGLKVLGLEKRAAFYAPGHKGGRGTIAEFRNLVGSDCLRGDVPELPGLDNLFAPEGIIREAQELAARLFGAEHTWFVTNGSTGGILGSLLATMDGGGNSKVIVPRNAHRSLISGLILSGANPIFVNPPVDGDLAYGLTVASVRNVLARDKNVKAVMILTPTYEGVCADIKGIVEVAHGYGVPVIVDGAHGAHLGFHGDLPPSSLAEGADVVVQSTHKTLGALTQGAMLHCQGDLVSKDRISKALALVQSTSPSYLLLASLDGARGQMAREGKFLMARTIALADRARSAIAAIKYLSVLEKKDCPGFKYFDPTRLTVFVDGLSIDGFAVDEILHQEMGVTCELPTLNYLTFIISLGNTEEDIDRLIGAWTEIAIAYGDQNPDRKRANILFYNWEPTLAMTPREAFFRQSTTIKIEDAGDRVCAETICPYPPGIPVLLPGEVITQEVIDYLLQLKSVGAVITGAKDSSLNTLEVV